MNYLIMLLMVLVSVAYLTLLERKLLSYIQIRKGPNKVGVMGIFQPFSDGMKLLLKESIFSMKFNLNYYYLCPVMIFFISLLLWFLYPYYFLLIDLSLSLLWFFCILSMNVIPIMIMGWASNSLYSSLGSLRVVAQTISYEICLILLFLSMMVLIEGYNFWLFILYQKNLCLIFMMWMIMFMMFISMLAEMNRTPFDLVEGESELVSGFNVEYMSSSFAMIFLGEYSNIIFLMMIYSMLGLNLFNLKLIFFLSWMLNIYFIMWIRGVLPRIRYDSLMYLIWLIFLPCSLNYLIFIYLFKYMLLI
uniref:NADH-ubiquinone oxidoreductase chain 1 n=1 Tax=Platygaster sp. ZJUH_2016029 TaxID=2496284 RepID=A0A3S5HLQ4_9HYME|nr:NADH dehydrogenase subunit 1 [Platygaster sp. ZJUH_2016029]